MDDAESAMRQRAQELLGAHGDGAVPVRLSAFFEWAGIRKVRSEEMPLEGALRRLPDGRFDVLLREDASPRRQRFSLAHELGHVLFYRYAPRAKAHQMQRNVRAPQEEERLCNVAAEELLMPSAIVSEALTAPDVADRVVRLAQQCEVSIEAAMVRLAPVCQERGEVQLWQYRGAWKPILVRRLGGTRGSLADFGVDEWDGNRTPERLPLPWRASTALFSRSKRAYLFARTVAIQVSRRVPMLLISHALGKESRPKATEIERAAADRMRRARATPPLHSCEACGGAGVIYPDPAGYPANRNEPPRMCLCRYDQRPHALSA
jgi:hypothetical protein